MSEVIRCPKCKNFSTVRVSHFTKDLASIGLVLMECENCKRDFFYNTGNSTRIVNNIKNEDGDKYILLDRG